jgi:hypothetical protein
LRHWLAPSLRRPSSGRSSKPLPMPLSVLGQCIVGCGFVQTSMGGECVREVLRLLTSSASSLEAARPTPLSPLRGGFLVLAALLDAGVVGHCGGGARCRSGDRGAPAILTGYEKGRSPVGPRPSRSASQDEERILQQRAMLSASGPYARGVVTPGTEAI